MSEDFRLLNGTEIQEFLGILLDRLAERGVVVETYIIGGAAMAIHLGRDQLTPDVDGFFRPQEEVFAEAAAMAKEFGLAPDWVNSRAAAFMSFDPASDVDALRTEIHGHPVVVASKRVLLAMKIAASRTKDRNDTNRLIADLGITDAVEIVGLAFAVFGEYSITLGEDRDEVLLIAQEALDRAAVFAQRQSTRTEKVIDRPRVPRGAPGSTGGQYAEHHHSDPEVSLD